MANENLVESLSRLLADSYTLYLKTHNFHWNVKGPMFTTLHTLFETEYTELALAVDEIAERIRAVGAPAPGSYAAFARLTSIKEAEEVPIATEMVEQLASDQDTVGKAAAEVLKAAQAAGDEVSADLAIQRMQVHEKNAWMLRSHLE
ncbi:MAG: Dps family protein [Myxococcota bacterium]